MAYALMLWGLAQTDLAVAQFIRSIHLSWLEWLGDVGGRLGDGWTLVLVSAAVLAVGLARGRRSFREAGVQSLLSHAGAGLLGQLLKRLVGRPRPRWTHDDPFQFGPSLVSGLDSFPSGHATASFAVAAVFASRFPKAAWPCYGLAGYVSLSRVVRGSHFPTDVAVGALLGLVIGLAVAAPRGGKWPAIRNGVVALTLGVSLVFMLLWVALHPAPPEPWPQGARLAGLLLVLGGAGLRAARTLLHLEGRVRLPGLPAAHGTIAAGLGLSTGFPILIALGALLGTMLWLMGLPPLAGRAQAGAGSAAGLAGRRWPAEVALLLALALLCVATETLRGALPLL